MEGTSFSSCSLPPPTLARRMAAWSFAAVCAVAWMVHTRNSSLYPERAAAAQEQQRWNDDAAFAGGTTSPHGFPEPGRGRGSIWLDGTPRASAQVPSLPAPAASALVPSLPAPAASGGGASAPPTTPMPVMTTTPMSGLMLEPAASKLELLQEAMNSATALSLEGRECYFRRELPANPVTACFCYLAGNVGCIGDCGCLGGCPAVFPRGTSVTFINLKRAQGCSAQTAVLTIPRSSIDNLAALRSRCPQGSHALLTGLLLDGFTYYQDRVAKGPVQQCVHAPAHVTVSWLHVHTFCSDGYVDGMPLSPPQRNQVAYCETMFQPADALDIAQRIIDWVAGL